MGRGGGSWPGSGGDGEGLGEHGIPPDRRHGYHLYANQTQVPLIVRVPAPGWKPEGYVPPATASKLMTKNDVYRSHGNALRLGTARSGDALGWK